MQQINLSDKRGFVEPKKGFWRRQFQKEATGAQKTFDWIFGVIMPVVCFVFDPIVFKSGFFGTAYLGKYKPFAYLLSFVTVMTLSACLIWGERLKRINGFFAGLFLVSGIVALIIGVVLTPLSLLGLIYIIGALGFTPLFSAFVYFRSASRVYKSAIPLAARWTLHKAILFGVFCSFVLPATLNVRIEKIMSEIVNGDAPTICAAAQKLTFVAPLISFDRIVSRHRRSLNEEEAKALADVYQNLTGRDIAARD